MIVNIIDGRKESKFENSTKVLVDIFRSTSTMPVMFKRGIARIIPAATIRETKDLKRKHREYFVVGERYGFKVPGFDMNNSPQDALERNYSGKTAIFTSTNGTLVLKKISSTGKVFISSFLNFSATLEKLKNLERVDIVVSNRPDGPADEDLVYAEFLKEALLGNEPDFALYAHRIRNSKGAGRLKLMGAKKDIETSLKLDYCEKAVIFDGEYIVIEE